MRRRPGMLALLACAASGCNASANAPAIATPTAHVAPLPTTKPSRVPGLSPPATAVSTRVPRPFTLYSQEHVGNGKYQLINNLTYQFVSVTAEGVRAICAGGNREDCHDYVIIGATDYSGNYQVHVSPRQFTLASTSGVRYAPATVGQAAPVVKPDKLLPATELQPDDDGDYVSGTVVFRVPRRAGRFSLLWQGIHVATFVKTAQGKLYETR